MSLIYSKSNNQIIAGVGDPFVIELEGNPTTGYEWQLQFDSDKIVLLDQQYKPVGSKLGRAGCSDSSFELPGQDRRQFVPPISGRGNQILMKSRCSACMSEDSSGNSDGDRARGKKITVPGRGTTSWLRLTRRIQAMVFKLTKSAEQRWRN